MAPRTLNEIFSYLQVDSNCFAKRFFDNLEEILSHPKDDILSHLQLIDEDSLIFTLRQYLFASLLDTLTVEEFASNDIILDEEEPTRKNIRRRQKASTCYEDIYSLCVSIAEKAYQK